MFFDGPMPKAHHRPGTDEQVILKELRCELALPSQISRWNSLVRKHHYLKNAKLVGEQLRYIISDAQGRWLALIGWSAAALHLKARDQSIEWSERQRQSRLHLLAQNSRLVILADRHRLPNVASRGLSLCLQRLSE